MAINVNKVILAGHLTREPELRYAATGTPIARFGLAVNTTSGQGESRKDSVCFVEVTVFGRQGETVAAYLTTGSPVMLEGRLEWQSWKGSDGQARSKHTVVAERVHFLSAGRAEAGATVQASVEDAWAVEAGAESVDGDDAIPF